MLLSLFLVPTVLLPFTSCSEFCPPARTTEVRSRARITTGSVQSPSSQDDSNILNPQGLLLLHDLFGSDDDVNISDTDADTPVGPSESPTPPEDGAGADDDNNSDADDESSDDDDDDDDHGYAVAEEHFDAGNLDDDDVAINDESPCFFLRSHLQSLNPPTTGTVWVPDASWDVTVLQPPYLGWEGANHTRSGGPKGASLLCLLAKSSGLVIGFLSCLFVGAVLSTGRVETLRPPPQILSRPKFLFSA